MNPSMKVVRLYVDETGESHFADELLAMTAVDFAPPAPAVWMTGPTAARCALFLHLPEGWHGEPHPAPSRQLMVMVQGTLRTRVSDGEVRDFGAGDAVLVEDTSGKGHLTHCIAGPALVAVTQL